ncbi:MAG: hypothetical protein AAF647_05330 [Pseudomonadota bacterium]
MKKLAIILAFVALPSGAFAQTAEDGEESGESGGGASAMERGLTLFFEGLREEMAPTLRELEGFARDVGPAISGWMDEMAPAFEGLLERLDDLSNYEAPIMLPNGDILIKRKPEAPELPEMPDIGEDGIVDL